MYDAVNIGVFYFQDGNTPLHLAALRGNLRIVQLLLERTDINQNERNEVWYQMLTRIGNIITRIGNFLNMSAL